MLNTKPNGSNAYIYSVGYEEIVGNMVDVVWQFQFDNTITFVNDACCRFFGKKRNELLGHSFLNLFAVEEYEFIKKKISSLNFREPATSYLNFVRGRNKEVFWYIWNFKANFNENLQLIDFSCVGRDITMKKCDEKMVSNRDIELLGDEQNINSIIFEVDLNAIFIYVSPKINDLLGYQPEEVIGSSLCDFIHEDEARQVDILFSNMMSNQGACYLIENTWIHKKCYPVVLESNAKPIFNNNGSIMGYRSIARKVNPPRMVTEDLQITRDELEEKLWNRNVELSRINKELNREICERVQVQQNMEYKLRFEELLLGISEDFNNIELDDIDGNINRALQLTAEFTQVDRSYVFIFSSDGMKMNNTHEWCTEGIEPEIEKLKDLPVDIFPWWMEKLQKHEPVYISDIDELLPEAQAERGILASQNIKSLLAVPISYKNELLGYLGFDSVKQRKVWKEDNIVLLKMLADFIANAMARKRNFKALQESEDYYRTIFEHKGSAIAVIDENMIIKMINGEFTRLFKYTAEEIQGENSLKLVHPYYINKITNYHRIREESDSAAPVQYNARLIGKEGKSLEVLITVALIPGNRNKIVSLSDITPLKRANRAHKTLSASNMALVHAVDEKSLLQTVCQLIVEIGGYSFAWVGGIDNKGCIIPQGFAGSDDGHDQSLKIARAAVEYDGCIVMKAIKAKKPLFYKDLAFDCRENECKQSEMKYGCKSSIVFPLMHGDNDNPMGILHILASEENIFDKHEMELLKELAGDLAYGIMALRTRIERDKAVEELQQSLNKQRRALNQTVGSLGTALEKRDPYTAGHQKRVADLACAIARELGFSKDRIEGIAVAGALHDIGKINIPTEILNRPGRLSEIEFNLVKTHSQLGFEILKDIEFPQPVAEIVLQHHEKLDGSGYPWGLTDKDILMEAKILAVADVVEAMASHRPYRPALGLDAGLDEISAKKGELFDPGVVDSCIKLFKEKGYRM